MVVRFRIVAATLSLLVLGHSTALADEGIAGVVHEVKMGILAHDIGGLWSGFNREEGADLNLEAILTPSITFWTITLRPAIGVSVNTSGDTSKIYLDARFEHNFEGGVFVALGVGAAVHDGEKHRVRRDRKALGSEVLFHFPVEIGYRFDDHNSVSVFFDHISNANLADRNEGMDTLGLRYGYRF